MTEQQAMAVALRYQSGFSSDMRTAELHLIGRPDQFSDDWRFEVEYPNQSFGCLRYERGRYETDKDRTQKCKIFVDEKRRRVWTDFVDGAGVSF